jgi:hypothetical protein
VEIGPADMNGIPFQIAVHLMFHIPAQGFIADKVGEPGNDHDNGSDNDKHPPPPSVSIVSLVLERHPILFSHGRVLLSTMKLT